MLINYDLNLIRAAQLERGWTHQELARQAQVSEATAWRAVTGKHRPTGSTVRKLAFALGISMKDLLKKEAEAVA